MEDGGVEAEKVDEVDEEASEGRRPKLLKPPTAPTLEEVEEHESLGHSTRRSWCGHCVRARGLMEQHRKQEKDLSSVCLLW